jgi:NAD-dependent dihydropyrimidine dehydrogenase PreA subunit
MAVREIIEIDEELCDGCGVCVPACAEGAIAIVDGKARLVSEVYCDGLGACLGHCPQGAITVVRRDAQEFDEAAVARHLGVTPPTAESQSLVELSLAPPKAPAAGGGCPGSRAMAWEAGDVVPAGRSALAQWPVQLHLLPPAAPFLRGKELVLAADCGAFAAGDFHARFLAGRALAIGCPKLDSNQEIYLEKLAAMAAAGGITGIHVVMMEVPCCGGLYSLAASAVDRARAEIPVRRTVLGIRGQVLEEEGTRPESAGVARGQGLPVAGRPHAS